jgi:hypothetical protein
MICSCPFYILIADVLLCTDKSIYIYIYGLFPLDFLFLEKEKGKPLHRERFMAPLFLDLAQLHGFTLTAYEFYSPPGFTRPM